MLFRNLYYIHNIVYFPVTTCPKVLFFLYETKYHALYACAVTFNACKISSCDHLHYCTCKQSYRPFFIFSAKTKKQVAMLKIFLLVTWVHLYFKHSTVVIPMSFHFRFHCISFTCLVQTIDFCFIMKFNWSEAKRFACKTY